MADPRVFISYSHDSEDHREAVLQLAQQLRGWGVDVHLDRFVTAPEAGWPRWMMTEVDAADFVLLVCTPTYRRRFLANAALAGYRFADVRPAVAQAGRTINFTATEGAGLGFDIEQDIVVRRCLRSYPQVDTYFNLFKGSRSTGACLRTRSGRYGRA